MTLSHSLLRWKERPTEKEQGRRGDFYILYLVPPGKIYKIYYCNYYYYFYYRTEDVNIKLSGRLLEGCQL